MFLKESLLPPFVKRRANIFALTLILTPQLLGCDTSMVNTSHTFSNTLQPGDTLVLKTCKQVSMSDPNQTFSESNVPAILTDQNTSNKTENVSITTDFDPQCFQIFVVPAHSPVGSITKKVREYKQLMPNASIMRNDSESLPPPPRPRRH